MENNFNNDELTEEELDNAIGGVSYEEGIKRLKEIKNDLIQSKIQSVENKDVELSEEELDEAIAKLNRKGR